MAAHGRGACGFGHRDMDRGRAAQAVWNFQRAVAGAWFASCNCWHSAFAGVWGLLGTPRKLEGRPHISDRDSYRGAHSARSAVVRVFHPNCADVLPIGVAQQGSGGNGAQAGDGAMSTLRTAELTLASRVASRANAYVALTKPDVSFLVLITTAAGFYMGSRGPVDWLHMVHTVVGTMLIAAGTAALNHYIERDSDRLMRRTASRPLPSGVLKPRQALVYGIALSIAGALYLYFAAGTLAAALGIVTCLGYLLAYTPLKKRTVWATFVGAFPGAIPPMIGWVAASGRLDKGAWLLFLILFFWQFPHFHAISWMYREDYARAGIQMLPVVDRDGTRTFRQIIITAGMLVGVSVLHSVLGLAGVLYFFGALVLSMALVQVCLWAAAEKTNVRAKWLMHATVIHIPILLGLMVYDKIAR